MRPTLETRPRSRLKRLIRCSCIFVFVQPRSELNDVRQSCLRIFGNADVLFYLHMFSICASRIPVYVRTTMPYHFLRIQCVAFDWVQST